MIEYVSHNDDSRTSPAEGIKMALFKKKPVLCPICNADLPNLSWNGNGSHWVTHVTQIPEGEGDASGQYTWTCVCGPANMKWPKTSGASSGLSLHMRDRHGFNREHCSGGNGSHRMSGHIGHDMSGPLSHPPAVRGHSRIRTAGSRAADG